MKDIEFNKSVMKVFKELNLYISKHDQEDEIYKKVIIEREKRIKKKTWTKENEIAFNTLLQLFPKFLLHFAGLLDLGYFSFLTTRKFYKSVEDLMESKGIEDSK